jgi:hypothetical protein
LASVDFHHLLTSDTSRCRTGVIGARIACNQGQAECHLSRADDGVSSALATRVLVRIVCGSWFLFNGLVGVVAEDGSVRHEFIAATLMSRQELSEPFQPNFGAGGFGSYQLARKLHSAIRFQSRRISQMFREFTEKLAFNHQFHLS